MRAFLTKQVSQDFIHSFLGLIAPGKCPFLPRAGTLPSGIVSGLSQVGEGSQEIRRLLTDRMRTQAMSKLRGEGPSPHFSIVLQDLP